MKHNLKNFHKANRVEFNSPSKLLSNTNLHDPFLNTISLVIGNLLSKCRKFSVGFFPRPQLYVLRRHKHLIQDSSRKRFLPLRFPTTKLPLAGQSSTIQYFLVSQILHSLTAATDCISGLQSQLKSNHLKILTYLPTMILITDYSARVTSCRMTFS